MKEAVVKANYPSFEEGCRADKIDETLPYEIGVAGRSDIEPPGF